MMQVSSPPSFRPLNSSPLASPSSPTLSSPSAAASARRRSQYKSHSPILARRGSAGTPLLTFSSSSPIHDTSPQKALVRRRFYDRCLQRLAKAKALDKRRFGEQSSDDMDYEDDEEETIDDVMASEFFSKCVANANYTERYRLKRALEEECGSSYDPDMVDIAAMERELKGQDPDVEPTPEDWEAAEIEAYVTEYEKQQAIADFENLPLEVLFQDIDEDLQSDPAMDLS